MKKNWPMFQAWSKLLLYIFDSLVFICIRSEKVQFKICRDIKTLVNVRLRLLTDDSEAIIKLELIMKFSKHILQISKTF